MHQQVKLLVVGLVIVAALILTACGGPTTAQCLQQANTSPGTISAGPVSIATDHSVYAPGDTIEATITNHLPTQIVVNNDNSTSNCPYFVLQMRAGNDWQVMLACAPPGSDMVPRNDQRLIAAGGSFRSFVDLHTDLPAGTYRLWISSYTIDDAQGGVASMGTAASATFRVCACSVCS